MPFSKLPDEFPLLRAAGFTMRAIRSTDVSAWLAYMSDPEVFKYTSTDVRSEAEVTEIVRFFSEAFRNNTAIRWAVVTDDDTMIGDAGYNQLFERDRRGEIGCSLARAHWRKGIMSAAVAEIVRFGFEVLDLNKVEAHVNVDNARSAGLLHKLGFKVEGTLRDYRNRRGAFGDSWHFGLLRREWQQRP